MRKESSIIKATVIVSILLCALVTRAATIPINDVRLMPVQQLAFFWIVPPKTSAQFEVLVNGNWEMIGPIENKTAKPQGFGMTLDASIGQVPRLVIIGGVTTSSLRPGERQATFAMRKTANWDSRQLVRASKPPSIRPPEPMFSLAE